MGTTVLREDVPDEPDAVLRSAAHAEALLLDVVARHADELLRVARAHSLCADDANDAYQRSLELFLRRGRRLRAETAHKWLFTVVKREAQAVRRSRRELVAWEDVDLERVEARHAASPEDRLLLGDDVRRSAEALRALKPAEVRALWLRASGRSYAEIQESTGWSYTKVNRCLAEGRRAFETRYAYLEDGSECARVSRVLSAVVGASRSAPELEALRPHLRNCSGCKATLRRLRHPPRLGGMVPPVLIAPAGMRPQPLFERLGHLGRWLTRLADAMVHPLGDRALKLQLALETTSAAKLAVVASSAAALAGGGGALVVDRTVPAPRHASAPAHAVAGRRVTRAAAAARRPVLAGVPAGVGIAKSSSAGAGSVARAAVRGRPLASPGPSSPAPVGAAVARAEFGAVRRAGSDAATPGAFARRAAGARAEFSAGTPDRVAERARDRNGPAAAARQAAPAGPEFGARAATSVPAAPAPRGVSRPPARPRMPPTPSGEFGP